MENLTDRQVELIKDLLLTYEYIYLDDLYNDCDSYLHMKEFIFLNKTYELRAKDYKKVCEIIDYIKGVKK